MLYHSFHVYVKETPVSFGVLFLLERETVVQRTTATVGSCAMTETWRPILQQLITELERQSVRMRELEAQRLVDLSVSWRFFMGCHFFLELEKYEICNAYIYIRYTNEYIYIYFIHLFVTYYIHMNFMWICIILIKRDGVLDIFQQKSKTSMVSCGVWSEEENSRPKREGDSQIFIFPFG